MSDSNKCHRSHEDGKKPKQDRVMSVLDVIEMYYPYQYGEMLKDINQKSRIFTNEEWIDILKKSRDSYKSYIKETRRKGIR